MMLGLGGSRRRTVMVNKPSKYIFVDGASFENSCNALLKDIFPNERNFLDLIDFEKVMKGYERGFYYDSLPAKKDHETKQEYEEKLQCQNVFFDYINTIPNLHARSGIARHRKGRGLEQKGVDVLLAIEMFQHAVRGNMDIGTIFTSDLDFFPLFEALVQTRVRTELFYNPSATSKELLYVVDSSVAVDELILVDWLKKEYRRKCCLLGGVSGHGVLMSIEQKTQVIRRIDVKEHVFVLAKETRGDEYYAYFEGGNSYKRGMSPYVLALSYKDFPELRKHFCGGQLMD